MRLNTLFEKWAAGRPAPEWVPGWVGSFGFFATNYP